MDKKRDITLDVIRVLACLMVFGVHFVQHISLPGAIGAFFEKGSTGVSFFFILSGLLAYYSMDSVLKKYSNKKDAVIAFWIKRLARILPLYFLIVVFYIVFFTVNKSVPVDNTKLYWLRYIFLLNTWVPSDVVFWVNLGALWSISVFAFFYLIAPFYYFAVQKYLSAWVGVLVSYVVMKLFDRMGVSYNPLKSLFYFFFGILLFIAHRERKKISLIIILGVILVFCCLSGSGMAIVPSFILALIILGTRNGEVSTNGLVGTVVTFLSGISYSIYLVHTAVIQVLDYYNSFSGIVYAVVLIVATFILSILSHKFVEEGFGKWLTDKLLNRLKR